MNRERSRRRSFTTGFLLFICWWFPACTGGPDRLAIEEQGAVHAKTAALERSKRRLFDGAPPVIAHPPLGAACISCHHSEGLGVPDLGFAPPSPHEFTAGMSSTSRCVQCHVFQQTEEVWTENAFVGLAQDLRPGTRLFAGAPPVMPHGRLMRENCQACHAGEAAREEIRTSHPERARCIQCHVEQVTVSSVAFP